MSDFVIRPTEPGDYLSISILLGTAFEGSAEPLMVRKLREQDAVAIELVALDGSMLIGHAMFSRLAHPAGWGALGPLAVRGSHRRKGVGSRLVVEGLDILRRRDVPAVVVLGDPQYYRRFGFSLKAAERLRSTYPKENLMLYPFDPETAGAARDIIYASAYADH